jgi:tetratricopeptide (TPR) repeat protein
MAKKDDWYRSSSWDKEAQNDFNLHIKRARKGFNRAQYFWLKAGALFYTKDADEKKKKTAIKLLERSLTESGELELSILCHILEIMGRYYYILKDYNPAEKYLKECIGLCGIDKRTFHFMISPEELLARYYIRAGDYQGARELFTAYNNWMNRNYLRCPDYAYFEEQEYYDVDGKLYSHPRDAAESIIVYHHAAEDDEPAVPGIMKMNYESLKELDKHFRIQGKDGLKQPFMPRSCYRQEFLEKQFLAALGSYTGCVCLKISKAKWKVNTPLMKSRLIYKNREFNPFYTAFETVYYEMPLTLLADEILKLA